MQLFFTTMALLHLLAFVSLISVIRGNCDPYSGPSGSEECVLLEPYYSKYQWATCLTDVYIRLYSKGNHACRNSLVKYCYYQCMIEQHNLEEGDVYGDCSCSPYEDPSDTTFLPAWCYSPPGDSCSWYRECLEKRYPCKSTGNSYAIDFAEQFCLLYGEHYNEFESKGQQWIDAVRKCLQVKLVPILRPYNKMTCSKIETFAMNSHPDCYINPDTGAPSVCDLSVSDWWKIFWTVKGAFLESVIDVSCQMLEVAQRCAGHFISNVVDSMATLELRFAEKNSQTSNSILRLATNKWLSKLMRFGSTIGIANVACFANSHFGLTKREVNQTTEDLTVQVLIASRGEYDLNFNEPVNVNMTGVMDKITETLENGRIESDLGNGILLTNASFCQGLGCNSTDRMVIQIKPMPNTSTKANLNTSTKLLVIGSLFLVLLLLV